MIMNHEIYMGQILLDTIKDELGEGEFTWYRDEMVELADRTYREKAYYLTEDFLIETKTIAKNCSIRKIKRDAIKQVKKDFSIIGNDLILEKLVLYIGDNEDDYLYLTRPIERNGGDIKGYNKLAKQL